MAWAKNGGVPRVNFDTRNRIILAALGIGFLGFGSGTLINQAIAHYVLKIPEGSEQDSYTVVQADPNAAPDEGADTPAPNPGALSSLGGRIRVPSAQEYAEVIVRRNIFDSSAVYTEEKVADGNGECRADSNIRLLATMVADPPIYSTALVAEGADRMARSRHYRIGDALGSDGQVSIISQKRICTDNNTCFCMDMPQGPVAQAPGPGGPPGGEGVTKLSETQFQVDRGMLDGAMGDIASLAGQIRATPHKGPNGEVDGFRLSSIRQGSMFSQLGIKNGDIVHAVNGTPLTSTEGAMGAYGSIKSQKAFTFEVTRRNQKMTMEYEVR